VTDPSKEPDDFDSECEFEIYLACGCLYGAKNYCSFYGTFHDRTLSGLPKATIEELADILYSSNPED
jgi:hypothetical protein